MFCHHCECTGCKLVPILQEKRNAYKASCKRLKEVQERLDKTASDLSRMSEYARRTLFESILRDTATVESVNEPLLRKARDDAAREKRAYEAEAAKLRHQCDPTAFMDKLAELNPQDLGAAIAQWKEKKVENEAAIPSYIHAVRVASGRLANSEKCILDLLNTKERLRVNTMNMQTFDQKKAELEALLKELRTTASALSSGLPTMNTEILDLVRAVRKAHAKD